ncbi:hypothetical protein F3Y22_tig00002840pilonHSYRG01158 [Hibiscus syriacus]|uniref:AAA+ ATPase domain-containing protein n=1 Tax=Hibiscus syriacus TaxID=106335 RepID=A0A6A3CW00_HIBSY|nr:hypothetical protein F3Y22_tig00002840pilonHSYRG01158 [Hibiscus syriacus]
MLFRLIKDFIEITPRSQGSKVDKKKLTSGTKVTADRASVTIRRVLPPEAILYGPPGIGKTLLAKAIACNVDANFLRIRLYNLCIHVVASSIMAGSNFLGDGARLMNEIFRYALDHQPCIIFMDEIDAICGCRLSNGTGIDREVQRTMMELISLRKDEISLPNENSRMQILKIHAAQMAKGGEINYEAVAKLSKISHRWHISVPRP